MVSSSAAPTLSEKRTARPVELHSLCSKASTVLSEGTEPNTMDVSFMAAQVKKYIV